MWSSVVAELRLWPCCWVLNPWATGQCDNTDTANYLTWHRSKQHKMHLDHKSAQTNSLSRCYPPDMQGSFMLLHKLVFLPSLSCRQENRLNNLSMCLRDWRDQNQIDSLLASFTQESNHAITSYNHTTLWYHWSNMYLTCTYWKSKVHAVRAKILTESPVSHSTWFTQPSQALSSPGGMEIHSVMAHPPVQKCVANTPN